MLCAFSLETFESGHFLHGICLLRLLLWCLPTAPAPPPIMLHHLRWSLFWADCNQDFVSVGPVMREKKNLAWNEDIFQIVLIKAERACPVRRRQLPQCPQVHLPPGPWGQKCQALEGLQYSHLCRGSSKAQPDHSSRPGWPRMQLLTRLWILLTAW